MAYRWFTEENIKTIPELFKRSCEKMGKKTALVFLGESMSYKKLWKSSVRIASYILGSTKRNDRVALFMLNSPQFAMCYYGALLAGRVAVPIKFDSLISEIKNKNPYEIKVNDEVRSQIINAKPSVIFVLDILHPVLSQIHIDWPCKIIFTRLTDSAAWYKRLGYPFKMRKLGKYVAFPKNAMCFRGIFFKERFSLPSDISLDAVAQFQATGGTTSTPKQVMLTHRNIASNIWQARERIADFLKEEEEVVLGALPFFHVYGLTACLNMTLLALRGQVVILHAFDPVEAIGAVDRYRVTIFPGVEKMYSKMLECSELIKTKDISSLKLCINGAGGIREEIRKGFEDIAGTNVVVGYGLSEASPIVSILLPDDLKLPPPARGSRIGKPLPETIVKIRDEEGNECVEGELWVRGPQVMKGYYLNKEATAKSLDGEWLKTGDIGYFDVYGHLCFTDRKNDIIKSLGQNIYATDIEAVLSHHRRVREVVVISVPDASWGEAAVAVVVVKEGESILPDLLRKEFASDIKQAGLSHLHVPRRVIILESLDPFKTIIGKILKRHLREHVKNWEQKESGA
ncbi:MAG: AMP-binding protein [bacterium]|nr:AMP-binding protein [bacterium]